MCCILKATVFASDSLTKLVLNHGVIVVIAKTIRVCGGGSK